MANFTINSGGITTDKTNLPNIDLRYGPYNSLEAAYSALEGTITPGLIIGIIEGDDIIDYKIDNNNKAVPYLPIIGLINNNTLVINGLAFTLTPTQTNDIIFGNVVTDTNVPNTGDIINIKLNVFNNTTTDFGSDNLKIVSGSDGTIIKTFNKAIKPGELITTETYYTVTEDDIIAGEIHQVYNLVLGNTTIKQTTVEITNNN